MRFPSSPGVYEHHSWKNSFLTIDDGLWVGAVAFNLIIYQSDISPHSHYGPSLSNTMRRRTTYRIISRTGRSPVFCLGQLLGPSDDDVAQEHRMLIGTEVVVLNIVIGLCNKTFKVST